MPGESHKGNYYFLKPDKEEKDFVTSDKYLITWCRWSQKTVEDWYEWEVWTDVWLKLSMKWPSPGFLNCYCAEEWSARGKEFIWKTSAMDLPLPRFYTVLFSTSSFTKINFIHYIWGKKQLAKQHVAKNGQNFHFPFYWWFKSEFSPNPLLQIWLKCCILLILIHFNKLQLHWQDVNFNSNFKKCLSLRLLLHNAKANHKRL